MTSRYGLTILLLLLSAIILSACGLTSQSVTETLPTVMLVVVPTETTPSPSATPTSEPTTQPTATSASTATSTPEGYDYSKVFFNPTSEADLPKVAEAPSPIDDKEKFRAWFEGYLDACHKMLETYKGPTLPTNDAGTYFASGLHDIGGSEFPVIAAYQFEWRGEKILVQTFVQSDGAGGYTLLSLAHYPKSSSYYNENNSSLIPPTGAKRLYVVYGSPGGEGTKDEFEVEYLVVDYEDAVQVQGRVIGGRGEPGDKENVERTLLIHGGYGFE